MNYKGKRLKIHMHFMVYLLGSFIFCMGFTIINPYSCMSIQAECEDNTYTDSQGLIFTIKEDNSCVLSGYTGEASYKLVIPADITVSGSSYKVKEVGSKALTGCIGLNELEISNEITTVATDAFSDIDNIEKIRIIPSEWSTGKRKRTALISIKLNSLFTSENVNTEVVITEDILKKALNYENTEEIRLTLKLNDFKCFPKITYGKKAAKMLRRTGKNLTLRLVDAGDNIYFIKLKSEDIINADGKPALLFNEITERNNYGKADKEIKKVLNKNGINKKNIRVLQYGSEAEEKPWVKLVLNVREDRSYSVYRYIEKEGKFILAGLKTSLTASDGKLGFYLQKNGIYIITKEPLKFMLKEQSDIFVREGAKTYYIKKGNILRGWLKRGKKYYYFDRQNGEMIRSAKVDGIKLRDDGTAVATEYAEAKIDVMMKARKIVDEITVPTDTKEEKMKKCFLWVFQYPYRRFRTLESVSDRKGWEITFANDIFDRKMGCCISESAAVAFLFKECGCNEVYIGSDTSHGWVEYNGRVYDPLFAEAKGFSNYYNVSYESSKLWIITKKRV